MYKPEVVGAASGAAAVGAGPVELPQVRPRFTAVAVKLPPVISYSVPSADAEVAKVVKLTVPAVSRKALLTSAKVDAALAVKEPPFTT
jgi:hypothetical protein